MRSRSQNDNSEYVYSADGIIKDVSTYIISYVMLEPEQNYRLSDLKKLVEDLRWWFVNYDLVPGFITNVLMFDAKLHSCVYYIYEHTDAVKAIGRKKAHDMQDTSVQGQ